MDFYFFGFHSQFHLHVFQLSASQSKQFLSDAIKADATVATIYYAFFALKNLGLSGEFAMNCLTIGSQILRDSVFFLVLYVFMITNGGHKEGRMHFLSEPSLDFY